MNKGILLVISGPSGCGKGTVIKEVMKEGNFFYSVSATTRAPREGEIHGKHYFFVSRERFDEMVCNNEFLEYTETYGNCYGTPTAPVMAELEKGKDIILELDVVGAVNVKRNYPDALLVFLLPPSREELISRLVGRHTENEEQLKKRIAYFDKEMELSDEYDFKVLNDVPQRAAAEIIEILAARKQNTK